MLDHDVWMIVTDPKYEDCRYSIVSPAKKYQRDALNDYINNHHSGKVSYNPEEGYFFSIESYAQDKFPGLYSFIRADGTTTTISRNKEELGKIVRTKNRMAS